ncbi:hypothetical protein [Paratractidigestivibacter sp.]|uniref:hypothetical protein n=1 Tax=Paratractidigestivibacter sp. TaxID=2847316 RepID=UPI002AC8D46A|nr:hypothetical protein [Paratractidigestivibacter sp.]
MNLDELFGNSGFTTFLGALVGAAASIGGVLLTNKSESRARREERDEERAESIRRGQVEEIALIEELIVEWARQMTRYYDSIIKVLRANPVQWSMAMGDSSADEALRTLNRDISLHNGRILDDKVRESVRSLTAGICLSNNADEIEAFVAEKVSEFAIVSDRLTSHHRSLLLADARKQFKVGA